jgi:hypothetical protein
VEAGWITKPAHLLQQNELAMMASSNSEIRPLVNALHTLLNKQLQQICATHGLKTSGVKAELQGRIRSGECAEIFPLLTHTR